MATDVYPDTERFPLFITEAMVAGVCFGFVFRAGYIGYGLWFETAMMPGLRGAGPSLSYGQESGVVMVLLGGLGFTVGLAIAISRHFSLFWGALLPAACSFVLAALSWSLWQDSISRYGRDPSEWIVHAPPLCTSIVVHSVSLSIAIAAVLRRRLRRSI